MKKILYIITQAELGGAQRYCLDLAMGLNGKYSTMIAAGEEPAAGSGSLRQAAARAGIPYFHLKNLRRKISLLSDLKTIFEIISLIKKERPDIIHLNSSKISILGTIANWLYTLTAHAFSSIPHPLPPSQEEGGIFPLSCLGEGVRERGINERGIREEEKLKVRAKIIYTAHGWVFNEPMNKIKKTAYVWLEKITAAGKDKIICVSVFDREAALAKKICHQEKLAVIHNGLRPTNLLSKEEARTALGLKSAETVIGAVSHLYKNKGYIHLINAGQEIKKVIGNNFKIVIIGGGSEKNALEEKAKQLGLGENVILTGARDASRLFKAFDIYACSSLKEGFPYSVLEAMAAGLPVIATRTGGLPEMIIDGKSGLLVEPTDEKGLADKIIGLIKNPGLAQELGAQAEIRARAEFGLEKMVEATDSIYERSLGSL